MKKLTAFEKLMRKVPVLEYTDDIRHRKTFDLKRAVRAAKRLSHSTFIDD